MASLGDGSQGSIAVGTAGPRVGRRVSWEGVRKVLLLFAWRLALGLAFLAVWQFASGRFISTFWFSQPTLIFGYLSTYLLGEGTVFEGKLISDVVITLRAMITGYLLGAAAGLFLGFLLAQWPMAAQVLRPYLLAIYGVPRIALAPIFILWFGIGIESKIMLAAMLAFFMTFFNTFTGIQSVDLGLKNVARVMGAKQLALVIKVILPAASPWIIAGLRVSIPYALVAAVVGEFIASSAGLGFRLVLAQQQFDTAGVMAGIFILMSIVMFFNMILDQVEGYVLRWRPVEERKTHGGAF